MFTQNCVRTEGDLAGLANLPNTMVTFKEKMKIQTISFETHKGNLMMCRHLKQKTKNQEQ